MGRGAHKKAARRPMPPRRFARIRNTLCSPYVPKQRDAVKENLGQEQNRVKDKLGSRPNYPAARAIAFVIPALSLAKVAANGSHTFIRSQ